MNFLRNLGNSFARFMYGRNGLDHFSRALIYLMLGLDIFTILFLRRIPLLNTLMTWAMTALMFYSFFRIFSKNLSKRRAENQKFLTWWWRVKSKTAGAKARHADKDHKYFTCKSCGTICRVPVGKGKIVITCPKCGSSIQAKS